jgi:hypothetical protein
VGALAGSTSGDSSPEVRPGEQDCEIDDDFVRADFKHWLASRFFHSIHYNSVMDTQNPHITPEQRAAISASGGLPIHIDDPETNKVYLLVEEPLALDHEYIQSELAKGIAAAEAGNIVAWDPERIKEEGRRRIAFRDTTNG